MSLIVPPSSIFAGQSNKWWRRSAALKMTCAAFVAGAVFAGLALKVPAGFSRGAETTAVKPAAEQKPTVSAEKRETAATSAAPCEQQTWPYVNDNCRNVKPAPKVQTTSPQAAEPVRVITPVKEPVVTATAAAPAETPRAQTTRAEADPNVGSAPRSRAQAELMPQNPMPAQQVPLSKAKPAQTPAQQALDSERAAQAVADRENALAAPRQNEIHAELALVPRNLIAAQRVPLPKARPQTLAQQALDSERAVPAVADRENALAGGDNSSPPSSTIASSRETIIAPKQNQAQESARKTPPREIEAAAAPARSDLKPMQRADRSPLAARSQARQAHNDEATQRVERSGSTARSTVRQARSDQATQRAERSLSTARSQAIQAQNEAEGFSLVRSHRLPDGRRVTVYRRVLDQDSSRAMAYGDPYRSRRTSMSPFSGNGFPFSFW